MLRPSVIQAVASMSTTLAASYWLRRWRRSLAAYTVMAAALIALPNPANASNGVSNPSFESNSGLPSCSSPPSSFTAGLATSWTSTSDGTADYHHTSANITACLFFTAAPRTGSAHTGFAYGRPGQGSYREFVQGQISPPLTAGQAYLFECYVRRTDGSAPGTIGALFTTNAPSIVAGQTPQVSAIVASAGSYTKISGTFTPSTNGYQTISIGAFNTNSILLLNYFYLDDVSVTPCSEFGVIMQQPTDQVLTFGQDASFSIQTSGPGITGYQWQRLDPTPVNLSNGSDYTGTDTATLTITAADYLDVGLYRCNVLYTCGVLASHIVELQCVDTPQILQQPASVTVPFGSSVTFTVGVPPFVPLGLGNTYAWYNDTLQIGLIDGPNITGSATNSLHIISAGSSNAGLYHCQITNVCGSTESQQALLQFTVGPVVPTLSTWALATMIAGMMGLGVLILARRG